MRPLPMAALALVLTAASSSSARAQDPLAKEQELLQRSAAAETPDEAIKLAHQAPLPGLLAAAAASPKDCRVLVLTSEAQLRAGAAREALVTLDNARKAACDDAAIAALSAWAFEHDDAGVRRGPSANLERAGAHYVQAALLYATRPDETDAVARALGSAAELALLRGNPTASREYALQALAVQPSEPLAIRAGVLVLRAAGPEVGEGAATELVTAAVDGELLMDILDARVEDVRTSLAATPGHPELHAAAAFYSLFAGGDLAPALTRRHVLEARKAVAGGRSPIELSYLEGRVAILIDDPAGAKRAFLKQVADYPQAAATRLAIDDLAWLLADEGGTPAEMGEALGRLDAELARTPEEAAMHETRSLLLERMARRSEALEAARRAQALEPTAERAALVARLSTNG